MAIEIPPTIDPAPLPAPQRGDRTTFSDRVDAFVTWLTAAVAQFGAVATNVYANATEALGYSVTAQNSAATAEAAAAVAVIAADATLWVSGQTYAQGENAISLIDFQTYRKKTAAVGGVVDPSLNATDWTRITAVSIGAGGDGSITGNVTLLATSPGAMVVAPTAPGLYATLPDATTCQEGTAPFSIYNAGDYDYGVKNDAGTQLGWVRPRTGAVIGLADDTTAAGSWSTYGLEKVGITATFNNQTITGMGDLVKRTDVDANRTFFLFGGTDCYGIVYDASTQSWGAPTLIRASVGAGKFSAVLSAAAQVLVVSCNSTDDIEAVTLTLSGTGIAVNSGTKATASLSADMAGIGSVVPVGSSWVFSYGVTGASQVRALTVSGTTPTIGAAEVLNGTAGATADPAQMWASGSVVRTLVGQSTNLLACKPFTVSGSTLTAGTEITVAKTGSSAHRAFMNGNGNIVAHYINSSHFAAIFKLTGTVEAASALSVGATAPTNIVNFADCMPISASKTALIWGNGSNWYCNILTDTAGVASAGTAISNPASNTNVQAILASGNSFRAGVTGTTILTQLTFDCTGASPVLGAESQLSYSPSSASTAAFASSDLSNTRRANVLVNGPSVRILAAAYSSEVEALASNLKYVPSVNPARAGAGQGVVGAAANESWSGGAGTSTGFVIQRVELAA